MNRFLKITLGTGFLTLAVSTPVLGDPILVTAGTVEIIGSFIGARIDISGTQGFSLRGSSDFVLGPSSSCGGCPPGEVVSNSGTVIGVSGTGTLNGATYPFNPGSGGTGMLTIVAPAFTLPPPAGFGEVTFETPFVMTPDSFLVFAFEPDVIRLAVAGSGRATGRFIVTDEPGLGLVYSTQGITYEFDPSPAAVPEPASLLLVGGGLAALWARRRRARNVAR